jgi:hypothetical protein
MYNTGIWDFVPYEYLHNPDLDICDSKEAFAVMYERNRPEVIQMFNLSAFVAQERKHMRLIYRNSHYNLKFPVLCADRLLEANLRDCSKIKSGKMGTFCQSSIIQKYLSFCFSGWFSLRSCFCAFRGRTSWAYSSCHAETRKRSTGNVGNAVCTIFFTFGFSSFPVRKI